MRGLHVPSAGDNDVVVAADGSLLVPRRFEEVNW
jgi:hypothetical protein